MTQEDKKDYLDMAKHFVAAGAVALLIAVLGSSVKAPGLVVPVGTAVVGALAYFGDKEGTVKKDRITKAVKWGGFTFVFTLLAVLFS